MKKNYSKLEEITVKSQAELDDIPEDFEGIIYIEFGDYCNRAVVSKRYRGSVEARGNSSVVAWENSSVNGNGNAQITDRQVNGRIKLSGNARTVCDPKTIEEYCSCYDIEHTKKKGKFYKAVHKNNGKYWSDWDRKFEYVIGKKAKANSLTTDPTEDCGYGIHISHKAWAIDYGHSWSDFAILEVEADLNGIIIPKYGTGKIRCAEVKVLREVPLEECGLYGKILAKRRAAK